jgi:Protein of unknown function (DUF2846)
MRRMLTLYALLGVASMVAACAPPDAAPPPMASLAGPVNPSLARVYFYRETGNYLDPVWTPVWLNGAKVGSSAPGSYFYRDVPPGTYTVTVGSDVPYTHQSATVMLARDSTSFVRIYRVEGYGVTNAVSAVAVGRHGAAAATGAAPSVFGDAQVDPRTARREIARLRPAG